MKNIDRADKQTNNILAPSANTTFPPSSKLWQIIIPKLQTSAFLLIWSTFALGSPSRLAFFYHLLTRPLNWISDHLIWNLTSSATLIRKFRIGTHGQTCTDALNPYLLMMARREIYQKIYTTEFLGQKFCTLKMRKPELILPIIKQRKFQYLLRIVFRKNLHSWKYFYGSDKF